jgi:hypothetical protein
MAPITAPMMGQEVLVSGYDMVRSDIGGTID